MKINILNKKVNYNWQWEEFEVSEDFFEKYNRSILEYDFEEIEWELIWKININKDILIWEIKQKYQDLIFSQYSLTDQLNMSNEAMQIMAFAQFEKRDFTEEEKTRLFEIQEAKVWVDTQRENCKNEILELWK